jgi:hypothetical protein
MRIEVPESASAQWRSEQARSLVRQSRMDVAAGIMSVQPVPDHLLRSSGLEDFPLRKMGNRETPSPYSGSTCSCSSITIRSRLATPCRATGSSHTSHTTSRCFLPQYAEHRMGHQVAISICRQRFRYSGILATPFNFSRIDEHRMTW